MGKGSDRVRILWTLEDVDLDGASRRRLQVDPGTRAAFLKKAGVGAVPSQPAARSPARCRRSHAVRRPRERHRDPQLRAHARVPRGRVLRRGRQQAARSTGETKAFAASSPQHEAAHVAFLKKALGAKAVAKPKFDFKGTTTDQAKFAGNRGRARGHRRRRLPRPGRRHQDEAGSRRAPAGSCRSRRATPRWVRDIRFSGGTTADDARPRRVRGRLLEGQDPRRRQGAPASSSAS